MAEAAGVERVRKAFESFARADIDAVGEVLAPEVMWHQAGNNIIAGDYKGPDEVMRLFGRLLAETDGTLRTEVHDVVGNHEHVVALVHLHGERGGKRLDQNAANVFHVDADGRIIERWLVVEDSAQVDDFWS